MIDLATITYTATTAIPANRFVAATDNDGECKLATADSDKIIGISRKTAVLGARLDVGKVGSYPLEFGGTVTPGDLLTADANGKGVVADTAGQRIGGEAGESGGDGTVGSAYVMGGTFAETGA